MVAACGGSGIAAGAGLGANRDDGGVVMDTIDAASSVFSLIQFNWCRSRYEEINWC